MKKIFAALCLIPSCLFGVVFESDQMKDILPQVEEGTWVLLDVDNTLIEASTQLGSAQWRDHIRSKARAVGYDKQGVEGFWISFGSLFSHSFVCNWSIKRLCRPLRCSKRTTLLCWL